MEPKRCPKCGREAAENQAFCAECLAGMQKYPVKPGVVVLLPRREQSPKPSGRRRHPTISPEEQIQKLKTRVTALALALVVAMSAACMLGWVVLRDCSEEADVEIKPGQNYSSDSSYKEEKVE